MYIYKNHLSYLCFPQHSFYNNGRLLTIYFYNAFFLFDTVVVCLTILLHFEEGRLNCAALKSQSDEICCSEKSPREIVDPVISRNNTQAFIAAKSKQLKYTVIGQRRVADFAVMISCHLIQCIYSSFIRVVTFHCFRLIVSNAQASIDTV